MSNGKSVFNIKFDNRINVSVSKSVQRPFGMSLPISFKYVVVRTTLYDFFLGCLFFFSPDGCCAPEALHPKGLQQFLQAHAALHPVLLDLQGHFDFR
jgi:hypothetical protein